MNKKELYYYTVTHPDWNKVGAWDYLTGKGTQKMFWAEVKKSLTRNWKMYKQWSASKMLVHLDEMIKTQKYKNVSAEVVQSFVRSFQGVPNKPAGIKLVDNIIKSIKSSKKGKMIRKKPVVSKQKNKSKRRVNPAMSLMNLKEFTWVKKHSRLWDSHVDWTVKEIWQSFIVYSDKRQVKLRAFNNVKNLNPIQREVRKRFNNELKIVKHIESKFCSDYCGGVIDTNGRKHKLDMHQRVSALYAWKKGFIDLGDTGVGKTFSSLASVALRNSMKTLIICPANLITNGQWETNIKNSFKGAAVYSQNEIIDMEKKRKKRREFYLVSFQTLSMGTGDRILRRMAKEKVNYVIIDEGQRVKIRDEVHTSKVRAKLQNWMLRVRKKRKLNVMMLTATPAPNTVTEAKSLLELVTGKKYDHVTSFNSIINLSRMHCELQECSIRFHKRFGVKIKETNVKCSQNLRLEPHKRMIGNLGFLGMDQIALSEVKMPIIIKKIKSIPKKEKVIIFTKYVTGMIDTLSNELDKNKISYTYFTGSRKDGLEPSLGAEFFNGKKVLIASSAVAEGIDRIQNVCRNIWFVGHGWTYSERQQVIGRLYRTGQKKDVNVLTFMAAINGFEYDQSVKIDRIETKKIYHDTIVNGNYPNQLQGKTHTWKKVVRSILRGENVKTSKVLDSGLIKKLTSKHKKIIKGKKK